MTINISTFIKDIINSKDICAKFGADVILDFIDITSNVQWSYHNYTKLNKTLVNSGKFSQSFIQTSQSSPAGGASMNKSTSPGARPLRPILSARSANWRRKRGEQHQRAPEEVP